MGPFPGTNQKGAYIWRICPRFCSGDWRQNLLDCLQERRPARSVLLLDRLIHRLPSQKPISRNAAAAIMNSSKGVGRTILSATKRRHAASSAKAGETKSEHQRKRPFAARKQSAANPPHCERCDELEQKR
jgi:hypothetical protein